MNISNNALSLLKKFEGFSAKPYFDYKGYSVGYGHLIRENEQHLMGGITPELAESLLIQDLKNTENLVKKQIKISLNQNQFDALVLLAYNIPAAITAGTVDEKLNEYNFDEALSVWAKYNKVRDSNGTLTVNSALSKRRQEEINLFKTPYFPQAESNPYSFSETQTQKNNIFSNIKKKLMLLLQLQSS